MWFLSGFEYINIQIDPIKKKIEVFTHEFHKQQPRFSSYLKKINISVLTLIRQQDKLPGLPYEGSKITILINNTITGQVRHIDFLPECLFMFGLKTKGKIAISSLTITGKQRLRPEYLDIGIWQQSIKPTTAENVNALIKGVKKAAEKMFRFSLLLRQVLQD